MSWTRRQFLKAVATSTVGAIAYVGCSPQPGPREFLMQSPVRLAEDLLSSHDNWYATACDGCSAGCGVVARVVEGRAKKLEGNPDHPVSRGKICLRGQAAIQALYHPDRLQGPQRRTGERGAGKFEPVSWDDALNELSTRLRDLRGTQADTVLFVTEPMRGHRALVVDRFVRAYGGRHLAFAPMDHSVERAAVRSVFGQDLLPSFDLAETQYLLSFGADFLHTWLSPVRFSQGYGELRQGKEGKRGVFVQVEPRLSATGASADEWVPVRPGSEGTLALSLAQVIVDEGQGEPAAVAALQGLRLEDFAPERVAAVTGVPAERIVSLARSFAGQRPSLAIAGGSAAAQTNGSFNVAAVLALNLLVGSVGVRGGVQFNPPSPLPDLPDLREASFADWQQLSQNLRSGSEQISALLVHGADPVYGLPAAVGFPEALAKVPYVVSFSSFLDETTAQADLILPDHLYLEGWGDALPDPGPGYQVVGFRQPVVNPVHDTRNLADVLLTVAEELGEDMRRELPWSTFRDVLREGAKQLQGIEKRPTTDGFEAYWTRLLQRGGWWDDAATATGAASNVALPSPSAPSFAGEEGEYPFHLIVYESPALGSGQFANLPWLQAAPDPLTTAAWGTWLEVGTSTARGMDLAEGDVVRVESPAGRMELPVYVHPGIPPWAVAVPTGQGHKSYGRYAEGRGANPLSLLAPLTDQETGSLAWGATRVRVARTGKRISLAKMEGAVLAVQPEDVEIVRVTRG